MINLKAVFFCLFFFVFALNLHAQNVQDNDVLTHYDTLRGSDNANRSWWDVLRYDISVRPDYVHKTIKGQNIMLFRVIGKGNKMQIDLQDSLKIDSIFLLATKGNSSKLQRFNIKYKKEGAVYLLTIPNLALDSKPIVTINYHGKPKEAVNPPWDGGWVWKKDKRGNAWLSVAVQSIGASAWYPCKDLQSDEPDKGISLNIITPDTLVGIGNGRIWPSFSSEKKTKSNWWDVKNPINNYCVVPYIGKYVNFTDTMKGEGGTLDLSYWVLEYNLEKAKTQFEQVKPMLHCFEYWFGKYPFYEDSYKLIEAPYLGMENQSAIAYGNGYQNGYLSTDYSKAGWGLKWDFIIAHESGHEWFGNSITTKDIADMWVHEGFTSYAEWLYNEWLFGKEAGNDYGVGVRKHILNDKPIIGQYGVNKEGSGDMYCKAANMIHNIRHIINNDSLFRQLLRGMNITFYHKTVTTQEIENYISQTVSINLQKVFDQYLRNTSIPELQFNTNPANNQLTAKWTNCIDGFDMPITIPSTNHRLNINTGEQSFTLSTEEMAWFTNEQVQRAYYINPGKLN